MYIPVCICIHSWLPFLKLSEVQISVLFSVIQRRARLPSSVRTGNSHCLNTFSVIFFYLSISWKQSRSTDEVYTNCKPLEKNTAPAQWDRTKESKQEGHLDAHYQSTVVKANDMISLEHCAQFWWFYLKSCTDKNSSICEEKTEVMVLEPSCEQKAQEPGVSNI